jgi:hypothetical protein
MTSFGLDPVLIRTVIDDYFISPLSPSSLDTFVSPLDTFVLLSGPMSLPFFLPLAQRTVCPTSAFLVSDSPSVPNLNMGIGNALAVLLPDLNRQCCSFGLMIEDSELVHSLYSEISVYPKSEELP